MSATRRVVMVAGIIALAAALCYGVHRVLRGSTQAALIVPPAAAYNTAQTAAPIAPKGKPASGDRDNGALVDICEVGKVRLNEDDPSGWEHVAALAEPGEAKWIAALQASGDPQARAAGFILARPEQSEALAQLVLQNSDPAVYGLALSSCAKAEHPGAACAQISPDTWAEMDADNAVAWFLVASRARLRDDAPRESAAMQRAAAAHRVDDYNLSLLAYAQPSVPADMGAAERNYFAIETIGVEVSRGATQYREASKYCSREAINDERVADECRTIADLFESRGNTMLDLMAAKSIGARVGWSKQRVEAATKYLEALMAEGEHAEPGSGAARWSCDTLSASNAFLSDLAQSTEISALRERYERSGVSVPELVQQHRDYIEKLMRDAQAAGQMDATVSDAR